MRSSVLILFSILFVTARAAGQQPPSQPPSPPRERIQVYAPSKGIVWPRLIPPTPPLPTQKNCQYNGNGKVVMALLIDTAGMPRNIMFQRPSGSVYDLIALNIAIDDRFQPGTLNGKPVVVAESLEIETETCVKTSKDAAGKISTSVVLSFEPHQKLKKPKNPPQEVVFAPLKDPSSNISRKITRPEYFSAAKTAPVLIYSAPASYTPRRDGPDATGVSKISLTVDAHGLPHNLRVLKSLNPAADRSALEAVSLYRFFPAIQDEEPVSSAIVVDVTFTPPAPYTYDDDD